MPTRHKLGTSAASLAPARSALAASRRCSVRLAHLPGMETHENLDAVLSLSELAARLRVSVQTIYDLRSQGRGPRGFRVGRELRFRVGEVEAWLARMEATDAARHPRRQPDGAPR